MTLTFEEDTHTYRVDGQVVPSVTQLISPLYNWAGIDREVLNAKAELGTFVHLACELHDQKRLDEASIGPEISGYLAAYRRFLDEKKPELLMCEQRLYSPTYRYAGTLDRVYAIDGIPWLVDLKASVAIYPQVGVQLAAYEHLIKPEFSYVVRGALQLRPDGRYKLEPFKNPADWPTFVGLIAVRNWRISNGI